MKEGQIWSYKNGAGFVYGWRVNAYWPPMGEGTRHIVQLARVKDPTKKMTLVLHPDLLIPMGWNEEASTGWTLIEDVP